MMQQQLLALKTISYSELRRFLRVWPQSLMPPVITMVLYFIVFGTFIGSQLSNMHGVSYMQYIVPGIIMMSIIMNAYNNTVFSFFIARFHRNIEEILVAPVSYHTILLGYAVGGVARGCITGLLVTIASLFFTHFVPHSLWVIFSCTILASLFFSLAGFTNAVFAKKFDDVSIVPTFVLVPLTYLGGVFYSVDQLPHLWRTVSYFNPILYIVSIFRYGFLGIQSVDINLSFIVLGLFVLAAYGFNITLLNKGVNIKT